MDDSQHTGASPKHHRLEYEPNAVSNTMRLISVSSAKRVSRLVRSSVPRDALRKVGNRAGMTTRSESRDSEVCVKDRTQSRTLHVLVMVQYLLSRLY
jgi:hypothetical protein